MLSIRSASVGIIKTNSSKGSFEEPTLFLEGEFSPRFDDGPDLPAIPESMPDDTATLQVLEQTARLTTQILVDYQVPTEI